MKNFDKIAAGLPFIFLNGGGPSDYSKANQQGDHNEDSRVESKFSNVFSDFI